MTMLHAFFLVGPTAVGKSAVAQYIAEQAGYAILSADSMVVYRGMDIGTAKPAPDERKRVPYGGIDIVDAGEEFSVGTYRAAALEFLKLQAAARVPVIVVGGSGLYVKSLTHGLVNAPQVDKTVRKRWQGVIEKGGVAALQEALRERAPDVCAALSDPANPRRLIRALEKLESGKAGVEDSWHKTGVPVPLVGLDVDRELFVTRVRQRVERMYRGGLLEECSRLMSGGNVLSGTAGKAIGYAEAIDFLAGRCTREEAMARTGLRTLQLGKKQRTWFRHQACVEWLRVEECMTVPDIADAVLGRWKKLGPVPIAQA